MDEFLASVPEALAAVRQNSLVIRQGDKFVAALVSEEEYGLLHEKRGQRALAALARFQDTIAASGASDEELKDLERELDRHL